MAAEARPPLCPALQIAHVSISGVSFQHDIAASPLGGGEVRRRRRFATYCIVVVPTAASAQPSWKIEHRFSAFLQLHRDLKALRSATSDATTRGLTNGLRLPTKFTMGSKTSKRVVSRRALRLETYLQALLSRLPPTALAARVSTLDFAPNAVNLLSDFFLCQYRNGRASKRVGLTRQGSAKSVRMATEAFHAQKARLSATWQNPLEARAGKVLKMTGQTVTELLNDELLKIVSNDPRRNGVTTQIQSFIKTVRDEFEQNADPRRGVEKLMLGRAAASFTDDTVNTPTPGQAVRAGGRAQGRIAAAAKNFIQRRSRATRAAHNSKKTTRFMSAPDATALERALEVSNKKRARRNKRNGGKNLAEVDDIESQVDKMVVKIYEDRLRRVMCFAEGVYDLILRTHLDTLMARLPPIPSMRNHDEVYVDDDGGGGGGGGDDIDGGDDDNIENNGGDDCADDDNDDHDDDDDDDDGTDPREEIVKHVMGDSVERAIYVPLHSILFYYATKLESTAELDMKIVGQIASLKTKFAPAKIPQSIFGINQISPSGWQLAVDRLSTLGQSKRPTHMLVEMLATVHIIHSLYFQEARERMGDGDLREPDPLGADDFLPIFVFIVTQSDLPNPQTIFQLISHLSNRDRLEGLSKYFLTVFESALWYLAHNDFADVAGTDELSSAGSATNNGHALDALEKRAQRLDGRLAALKSLFALNASGMQRYGRRQSAVLIDLHQLREIAQHGAVVVDVGESDDGDGGEKREVPHPQHRRMHSRTVG